MSSQNPLLNNFGGASRTVEQGVDGDIPKLGVPTNVPFVAPVKPGLTTDGLGLFNKLALSLGGNSGGGGGGGVGLGLNALAKAAQDALAKKREQQAQSQYSQGILEATQRAAKTRDFYTDLDTNGLIPASKNPYRLMGQQVGSAMNLAAQYRDELYQARQKNPLAHPQEIQDPLKQKYLQLMSGLRPEVARQYFIEPAMKADLEDQGLFEKEDSKRIVDGSVSDYTSGLGAVFNTETQKYFNSDTKDIATARQNIIAQANSNFHDNYSLNIPLGRYLDGTVDQAVISVKGLKDKNGKDASLEEKEGFLDALTQITDPSTGKPFYMTNLDYAQKVIKAKEDLRKESANLEKIESDAINAHREADTGKLTDLLLNDVIDDKIKDQGHYLRLARDNGWKIDPNKFNTSYSGYTSQNRNEVDKSQDTHEVDLQTDIENGMSPLDLQRKWRPVVDSGLLKSSRLTSAMGEARSKMNHDLNAAKANKIPDSYFSPYIKSLQARLDYPQGYSTYTGYSAENVAHAVNADLQLKYGQIAKSEVAQWREANPNAGEVEIQNKVADTFRKLQPQFIKDSDRIFRRQGNYRQIVGVGSVSPHDEPKQAPAKISAAAYGQKYSWALSPQSNKIEQDLFLQKRGRKYEFLVKLLEKTNHTDRLDYYWKKYSQDPEALVRYIQNSGNPTYLNKGAQNGR